MLCSTSAWADIAVLTSPDAQVSTLSDGAGVITITDKSTNGGGIQKGSGSFTYEGSSYTPMKLSGSRQFELTYNSDVTINSVKIICTDNKDDGNEYTIGESSDNRASIGKMAAKGATPSQFTITGKTGLNASTQFLAIIVVDYSTAAATKPTISVTKDNVDLSLPSYNSSKSDKVTLKGELLTDGTYTVATSATGLTLSPTSFTVADGKVEQEFTVTYAAENAVETATEKIVFKSADADNVEASTVVTYGKVAQRVITELSSISDSYTWDFSKTGATTVQLTSETSPAKEDQFVLANIAEINNDDNFKSDALKVQAEYVVREGKYMQGGKATFHTTVPGTIKVAFSNTGNRTNDDETRYLYVNGTKTEFGSKVSNATLETGEIEVEAGDVVLTAQMPKSEGVDQYIRLYSITFTAASEGGKEEGGEEEGGEEGGAYDNVEATISWTVGNETVASVTSAVSEAISSTKVKAAATLQTAVKSDYDANKGVSMVQYQPSTSNAGNVAEVMVEYTVKMQKGTTFTPTSISYDAIKVGTDNAYFSWSYTTDGTESDVTNVPAASILRNNNGNSTTAKLGHSETISNATAARDVTVRFYISQCANNKQIALSNIKINGVVNGTVEQRSFQNFKIDFRTAEPTIVEPTEGGLPSGVVLNKGTFKDAQHGTMNATITVPVDSPVKFTIGGCGFTNKATVSVNGGAAIDIDTKSAGCEDSGVGHYSKYATYTYNVEESATLVFNLGSYCPYFFAEACEFVPVVDVTYYDTDGKTVIGTESVEGSSALKYAYGASDVTVASGKAFRGWFSSASLDAVKIKEGTPVDADLKLYAKATDIEIATVGSVWEYDLKKVNFYPEDHELIELNGKYNDSQHGWAFSTNGTAKIKVAGNAIINFGLCRYAGEGVTITVTDEAGNTVGEPIAAKVESDGTKAVINYKGEATTLTLTTSGTAYIHDFKIFNIDGDLPQKNDAGYYVMNPGDGAGLLVVLASLQEGDKVFLPNGTYDFGNTVLTTISANNVSIIGESMEGTIIKTTALEEKLGVADLFYNTSTGLYMQDLTLQNDFDYYNSGSAGRAAVLQDNGNKTIMRNVAMRSYQDTYYSKSGNYYFEGGLIQGTVDYICGGGNAWFENITLLNKSRSKSGNTGDDTMTAYNGTGKYIFNNTTVESECATFNFGRSWETAYVVYLNTTIKSGKLIDTRFSTADMNSKPRFFGEYNTVDESGNGKNTPASNVLKTTKGAEFESVLTAEQAEAYAYDKFFSGWDPKTIATQEKADATAIDADALYLVENEGEYVSLVKGSELDLTALVGKTIRKANGRGGFGEPTVVEKTDAINLKEYASAQQKTAKVYDITGREVNAPAKGVYIIDGKKYIK